MAFIKTGSRSDLVGILRLLQDVMKTNRCMRCNEPVVGSMEVMVETYPAGNSDYATFMKILPRGKWVRIYLCSNHFSEHTQRADEVMQDERLWHPNQDCPSILVAEPRKELKCSGS